MMLCTLILIIDHNIITPFYQRAESLLSSDLTFPEGIAIDWISRNIYFTGHMQGFGVLILGVLVLRLQLTGSVGTSTLPVSV